MAKILAVKFNWIKKECFQIHSFKGGIIFNIINTLYYFSLYGRPRILAHKLYQGGADINLTHVKSFILLKNPERERVRERLCCKKRVAC